MIGYAMTQDEHIIVALILEIDTIMTQLEQVHLRKMKYQFGNTGH